MTQDFNGKLNIITRSPKRIAAVLFALQRAPICTVSAFKAKLWEIDSEANELCAFAGLDCVDNVVMLDERKVLDISEASPNELVTTLTLGLDLEQELHREANERAKALHLLNDVFAYSLGGAIKARQKYFDDQCELTMEQRDALVKEMNDEAEKMRKSNIRKIAKNISLYTNVGEMDILELKQARKALAACRHLNLVEVSERSGEFETAIFHVRGEEFSHSFSVDELKNLSIV